MEISATDAARRFSEMLDAVEHRGEHFVIVRRGRVVARMEPAPRASGRAVKEILRSHVRDDDWDEDLRDVRAMIGVEERRWSG